MFIEAVREWRQGFSGDLRDPEPWLLRAFGIEPGLFGESVGPRKMLESSPALRAIRIICESLSSVPLNLMEKRERKKEVLRDDDTHWLVHHEPNEMMSSAVFRQVVQLHVLTHGNGLAFVERERASRRPVALLPLVAGQTRAVVDKGRFFYETFEGGRRLELSPRDVLHVPWLSWNGIHGESPARVANRTWALGIAAEESAWRFFKQGMVHSAVIEQDPSTALNDEELEKLRRAVEAKFSGVGNHWRPLLLKKGLTWKAVAVDPDKAQAKQLREMNVADASRVYGVPLHLLASLETGAQSYASVEQFELILLKHTMLPWYVLWEQELNRKLLGPAVRGRRFFKFNVDALVRGDLLSRMQAHEIAVRTGIRTVNRVADLEDEDQYDIPEADEPLIQANNLRPLRQVAAPVEPVKASRAESLYRFEQRRCLRKLADAAAKVARRHGDDLAAFRAEALAVVERIAGEYRGLLPEAAFDRAAEQARAVEKPEWLATLWQSADPESFFGG